MTPEEIKAKMDEDLNRILCPKRAASLPRAIGGEFKENYLKSCAIRARRNNIAIGYSNLTFYSG